MFGIFPTTNITASFTDNHLARLTHSFNRTTNFHKIFLVIIYNLWKVFVVFPQREKEFNEWYLPILMKRMEEREDVRELAKINIQWQEKLRQEQKAREKEQKIQANKLKIQQVEYELNQLKNEIQDQKFRQQSNQDKLQKLCEYTRLKEEQQNLTKKLAEYEGCPTVSELEWKNRERISSS